MKIYKPEPIAVFRVSIRKVGEQTYYISLCETSLQEVIDFFVNLINSQNIPAIQKGYATGIDIREAYGAKNLKSQSISFKGLSPKEVYRLAVEALGEPDLEPTRKPKTTIYL